MLKLLIIASFLSLSHSLAIRIDRDLSDEWTTIVSYAHLVESFATLGQLHILEPDAQNSGDDYHINLYEYMLQEKMFDDLYVTYGRNKGLFMDLVAPVGFLRWYKNETTSRWKLNFNDLCVSDFDVSNSDNYHWTIILNNKNLFLKCNNVVVARVISASCDYTVTWGLNEEPRDIIGLGVMIGGFELIGMQGRKTRMENTKSNDGCGYAGLKHSNEANLIARKKLTTAKDCRYDCKFTKWCKTGVVDLADNTCNLYNAEAGTVPVAYDAVRNYRRSYADQVFTTFSLFHRRCDACKDKLYERVHDPQLGQIPYFLSAAYYTYTFCTRVDIWNIAPHFYGDEDSPDSCMEFGVLLEGNIIAETETSDCNWMSLILSPEHECVVFWEDCQAACANNKDCTGWSNFNTFRKCYLFSGPLQRKQHNKAVSGVYNCNRDLMPTPNGLVIQPVAMKLNMFDEVQTLNMYIAYDDNMRTVKGFEALTDVTTKVIAKSQIFKFEFYGMKRNSAWDMRYSDDTCVNQMFNYTSEPCAGEVKSRNYYSLGLTYGGVDDFSINFQCGDSSAMHVFSIISDIADCKVFTNSTWNANKFEGFSAEDQYNIGIGGIPGSLVATAPSFKPSTFTPPTSSN